MCDLAVFQGGPVGPARLPRPSPITEEKRMKRLLLAALMALVALPLSSTSSFAQWDSGGAPSAEVAKNCQNFLVPTPAGRTYSCEVKSSFGIDFFTTLH